jgi:hypothetical protein
VKPYVEIGIAFYAIQLRRLLEQFDLGDYFIFFSLLRQVDDAFINFRILSIDVFKIFEKRA